MDDGRDTACWQVVAQQAYAIPRPQHAEDLPPDEDEGDDDDDDEKKEDHDDVPDDNDPDDAVSDGLFTTHDVELCSISGADIPCTSDGH